jgi:hypothetical protein
MTRSLIYRTEKDGSDGRALSPDDSEDVRGAQYVHALSWLHTKKRCFGFQASKLNLRMQGELTLVCSFHHSLCPKGKHSPHIISYASSRRDDRTRSVERVGSRSICSVTQPLPDVRLFVSFVRYPLTDQMSHYICIALIDTSGIVSRRPKLARGIFQLGETRRAPARQLVWSNMLTFPATICSQLACMLGLL